MRYLTISVVLFCLSNPVFAQTCAEAPTQTCLFEAIDVSIAAADSPEAAAQMALDKAYAWLSLGDPASAALTLNGHISALRHINLSLIASKLAANGQLDTAIPLFDQAIVARGPQASVLNLLYDANTRQKAGDLRGAAATRYLARQTAAAIPDVSKRMQNQARVAIVQYLASETEEARATLSEIDLSKVNLDDWSQKLAMSTALRTSLLMDDAELIARFDTALAASNIRLSVWAAAGRLDDFATIIGAPAPSPAERAIAVLTAAGTLVMSESDYIPAIRPSTINRLLALTDAMPDTNRAGQILQSAMFALAEDDQFSLAASIASRIENDVLRASALFEVAGRLARETADGDSAVALLRDGLGYDDAARFDSKGMDYEAYLIGAAYLGMNRPDDATPWIVQANTLKALDTGSVQRAPTLIIGALAQLGRSDLITAHLSQAPDDRYRLDVYRAWLKGAADNGNLVEAISVLERWQAIAMAQPDTVDPAMAAYAPPDAELPTQRMQAIEALASGRANIARAQLAADQVDAALASLDGVPINTSTASAYVALADSYDAMGRAEAANSIRNRLLDVIAAGGRAAGKVFRQMLSAL